MSEASTATPAPAPVAAPTPTAPAAAPAAPLLERNGAPPAEPATPPAAEAQAWYTALPADLQADNSLANFRDKPLDELARGYVETKRLASQKVTLPKDDDPDSFHRFAAAVRPEDPTAYDFKLGDGQQSDFADFMRPKLHEAGLHPKQADILIEANNAFLQQAQAQAEQKGRDTMDALRGEMGANDFARKQQAAANMLDKLGIPVDFENDLTRFVGAENTLRLLFDFAEKGGELGKVDARDVNLAVGNMTGEAALEEARKMVRNDKEGALRNPDSEERKRYDRLLAAAKAG